MRNIFVPAPPLYRSRPAWIVLAALLGLACLVACERLEHGSQPEKPPAPQTTLQQQALEDGLALDAQASRAVFPPVLAKRQTKVRS